MKKSILLATAVALSVPLFASAAPAYHQSNFSKSSIWKNSYESYGYKESFKTDFLASVNEKNSGNIYHLGYGSIICNSDKTLANFLVKQKRSGGYLSSNSNSPAFPGCFFMTGDQAVAYVPESGNSGRIKIKFIMNSQPAWRNGFIEGYTTHWLINATKFDDFVKFDKPRFLDSQINTKLVNSMPNKDGVYPDKFKGDES